MTDDDHIVVSEGGFEVPIVEILTGRGYVFGKSGAGKSNTVGVIVEELLDAGFPLCIVDFDGEYWGLKEEYEILHVGAGDVDVHVGPGHADALAQVMLAEDVPVILDVSEYIDVGEADELIEKVIKALFSRQKRKRKPFPVFVEEAHEVIPEGRGLDDVGEAVMTVAKRGRKRGLGIVAASQRPASVDKDFVTQADWGVWHRLTWKNDTDVVKDVVGPEYAEAVQDLETGEAIVVADDWLGDPRTVHFRQKRTFDAGATPDLDDFEAPELQGVSEGVIEELRSITEEVEAEEEEREELEAEVERLEDERRRLESEVEDLRSGEAVESEEVQRLRERVKSLKSERDQLSSDLERAESALAESEERIDTLETRVQRLEGRLEGVDEAGDHLESALDALGRMYEGDDVRDRIEELEAERDQLKQQVERLQSQTDVPDLEEAEYVDFVRHEAVMEAIDEAKDESNAPKKTVGGVVAAIVDEGGGLTHPELQERLGLSTTSDISKATKTLENFGVVGRDRQDGREYVVDLDVEGGVSDIIRRKEQRERTEALQEDLGV